MIDDRELDLVLDEFLRPAGDRLPDRVLDDALGRAYPARRAIRHPWTTLRTTRPRRRTPRTTLAAIAAAVTVVVGGLVVQGQPDQPIASPQVAPSAVGAVDPRGGERIGGTWVGVEGNGRDGGWVLRLSDFATLQGPKSEFQILRGYRVEADALELPAGMGACATIPGTYRWQVTGATLDLTVVDDPCAERSVPLDQLHWRRVPDDRGVAHRFRFPFTYPLESIRYSAQEVTTTLHGFGGNHVDGDEGLVVWIVEDVFDDVCPPVGTLYVPRRVDPGVEALAERLQHLAGTRAEPPISTTAAGRPATLVRITATASACPRGIARLWEDRGADVGSNATHQFFELQTGGRADAYIVDVEGEAVTFLTWAKSGEPTTALRADVIEGIRFVDP